MFFPEKITLIGPDDRVLEVGPGGLPHPRSDVFLELKFDDEEEWMLQRGKADKLKTDKPVVYYDGGAFPFKTLEFDYIICSHVLEHAEDPEQFLSEMFRVAPKGYIEYPTIYYEYIYNFKVHLNIIKLQKDQLMYLRKDRTPFDEFSPVQLLFRDSLEKGHNDLVDDLKSYMFEGFEWTAPFQVKETSRIKDLTWNGYELPDHDECTSRKVNIKKLLLRKIAERLGNLTH